MHSNLRDTQEIDGVMYKLIKGETVTSCVGCHFYMATVGCSQGDLIDAPTCQDGILVKVEQ